MAKSKHIDGIDCESAAGGAIRSVLIARFEEMCALRDHALDWSDPEGVHDMRVSSRRLRGALHDFMPYLHKRRLAVAMDQISDLAAALGAVRDQDVAIIGLQKLCAGAPDDAAAILNQLVRTRETIRKQARKDLRQSLQKSHLKQLRSDFLASVDSIKENPKPRKRRSKSDQAGVEVTYREVARGIIKARLKEVEKLSDSLYRPLKMKPLHRMRIAAKRLRYALELFEPCWGPGISGFARKVAALQTSLGELHDSDIWIETFGEHLDGAGKESKDRSAAALWLLGHFVRLHSKHLRDSLEKWRDWEANDSGSRLRDCLQPDPPTTVQSVDIESPGSQQTDSQSLPLALP